MGNKNEFQKMMFQMAKDAPEEFLLGEVGRIGKEYINANSDEFKKECWEKIELLAALITTKSLTNRGITSEKVDEVVNGVRADNKSTKSYGSIEELLNDAQNSADIDE